MYKIFAIVVLSVQFAYGKILIPLKNSTPKHNDLVEVFTNSIYEEVFKRTKDLNPEEEVKKVKFSLNDGKRGKAIIEEMKRKNREKIARMRGFDPENIKDGKDLVNLQRNDNKTVLKKMKDEESKWEAQAKEEIDNLRRKVLEEHKEWRKKHAEKLKAWAEKKKGYNKEIDDYKNTLIKFPLIMPISKEELEKKVEVKIEREFRIVDSAFVPNVRDQKFRSTCSSFSGIRQIEILLAQNNQFYDLSEQYFYWASKPNCRDKKCINKGSWVGNGLAYSRGVSTLNIPKEKDCPYHKFDIQYNETQIPLAESCREGVTRVEKFRYLKNLDQVINALDQGKAVGASVTLTPNFYDNQGLVLDKESQIGGKLNSHAAGHSVLLIGYLKIPKILNEGSVCFITANSWGKGWGVGGHACLSENWVQKNRKRNPFVIVDKIQI